MADSVTSLEKFCTLALSLSLWFLKSDSEYFEFAFCKTYSENPECQYRKICSVKINGYLPPPKKRSHRTCSVRKLVLENFAKFTGKTPVPKNTFFREHLQKTTS